MRRPDYRHLVLAISLVVIASCASPRYEPKLSPGARAPAEGVDLSGYWRLQNADTDPLIEFSQKGFIGPQSAGQVMRIREQNAAAGRQRGDGRREKASLAQVFLETGSRVKITQTHEGMFISFDRSIVEEYLFGEHRLATVGPVAAERASGWQEEAYVVETLDRDEVLLRERWYLDGDTLKRDVRFTQEEETLYEVTQAFDRQAGPN